MAAQTATLATAMPIAVAATVTLAVVTAMLRVTHVTAMPIAVAATATKTCASESLPRVALAPGVCSPGGRLDEPYWRLR